MAKKMAARLRRSRAPDEKPNRLVRIRRHGTDGNGAIDVYAGRTSVGTISRRGGKWLARDVDGRRIGLFTNKAEAFACVLTSAPTGRST